MLSPSLISTRKFSMQESRESATKQNGGRVRRKEDWRRVLGTKTITKHEQLAKSLELLGFQKDGKILLVYYQHEIT